MPPRTALAAVAFNNARREKLIGFSPFYCCSLGFVERLLQRPVAAATSAFESRPGGPLWGCAGFRRGRLKLTRFGKNLA